MQPQNNADSFAPKWRHFHPQATVWVLNPFNHDVLFRVADESGTQSEFRIQANERAELPGGAIATLGVKAIVDEMVQNNSEDVLRLYDAQVRSKYEEQIILRVKEAPTISEKQGQTGVIDLTSGKPDKAEASEEAPKEEVPFAEVKDKPEEKPVPPVGDIAVASLGSADQVVEE